MLCQRRPKRGRRVSRQRTGLSETARVGPGGGGVWGDRYEIGGGAKAGAGSGGESELGAAGEAAGAKVGMGMDGKVMAGAAGAELPSASRRASRRRLKAASRVRM